MEYTTTNSLIFIGAVFAVMIVFLAFSGDKDKWKF
jgi:hypothetical protein